MQTDPAKIRYVMYCRKSSEAEDRQVASIDAQILELKKLAEQKGYSITRIFQEAKSAKAPGRPVFNEMLQEIYNRKAQGIICWKLDRLARNPVDGGQINWMLQQGVIQHIRTIDKDYMSSDNVLLMSFEFGMANQFIRDLSQNTKRGLQHTAESGWLPTHAPIGYLNNKHRNPGDPQIVIDPARFPLIRKLFELMIEKQYSVQKLHDIATGKLNLKNHDSKPLSLSKFHELLRNPFYYGEFNWKGNLFPGKHTPVISRTQFETVQSILNRNSSPHTSEHNFAFTGTIRCGECNGMVTAQENTKKQKNGVVRHYTYYHCGKRINRTCKQKSIRQEELEKQINHILCSIKIHPKFHKWAMDVLRREHSEKAENREQMKAGYRKALDLCAEKIDKLLNTFLNNTISEAEYRLKKEELTKEKARLEELLTDTHYSQDKWLDAAEKIFSFSRMAQKRFNTADARTKQIILSCLGSNPVLKDGKLQLSLYKPLLMIQNFPSAVKADKVRFKPLQVIEKQGESEAFKPLIPLMGG